MATPDRDAGPRAAAQSSNSEQTSSFEEALAALGDTVIKLESGGLGLSESIAAYERGVTILRRLHEELAAVEERVNMLVRIDEDGRPVLGALPAAAETNAPAKKAGGRGAGAARAPRAKSLPGMDDAGDEA